MVLWKDFKRLKKMMIPNSYLIEWDYPTRVEIYIVATKFNDDGSPISWAVRQHGFCMSKIDGEFGYEYMPSSRTEKFFEEFRFNSAEEAYETYKKFQMKK
jgi:hypothetical protein